MADKRVNVTFDAKIQTDVGTVKSTIADLKKQLQGLEIPKGASKDLEKTITGINQEIEKFEGLAAAGISSLSDTKKLDSSWKKISQLFNKLGTQTQGLSGLNVLPKSTVDNINKANKALQNYNVQLEKLRKNPAYMATQEKLSGARSAESAAKKSYNDAVSRKQNADAKLAADKANWEKNHRSRYEDNAQKLEALNAELETYNKNLEEQKKKRTELQNEKVLTKSGTINTKFVKDLANAESELAEATEKTAEAQRKKDEAIKNGEKLKKALSSAKGVATKAKNRYGEDSAEYKKALANRDKAQALYDEQFIDIESYQAKQAEAQKKVDSMRAKQSEALGISGQIEETKKLIQANEQQAESVRKSNAAHEKAKTAYDSAANGAQAAETALATYKQGLKQAAEATAQLETELKQIETTEGLGEASQEWKELVDTIQQLTGADLSQAGGDVRKIVEAIDNYREGELEKLPEHLQKIENTSQGARKAIEDVGEEVGKRTEEFKGAARAEQDIERLKNQILDFFSISNTIQIFKNAIRDAFNTVKELDAAMTETAVVTDFSIGDMWDKLPEYSKQATELGTSIKSLYEATTLYYQQGLNSQQAMGVGIETMKMARIAGMDAADATEAMTAALRGFNLEINEMSATRINDVYSELAAITASDTSQIATAMTKTASIAASANMEFETTAALLAQIIETTQEAPETAGTAMKTIIARFTEVKELFSQGMLSGTDSDGESIDINKIDAALKTVGISLKDFLNGSKGIDDIFLELAEKWDTLDLATQRYIATTAAGSRQQSRFIAMMSNYDRTMELVNAANNSAGASTEQFGKTLESLDSKLQRLRNAWQEFTMGLANNSVIKLAVDGLTGILETVNKITGFAGTDGLGGIVTVIMRLGTVLVGLKAGETVLSSLIKTLFNSKGIMGVFLKNSNVKLDDMMGIKDYVKLFQSGGLKKGFSKSFNDGQKAVASFTKGLKAAKIAVNPYVIALTVLAGAVALVVRAMKKLSVDNQLERVNEKINNLGEEANSTKQAIKELGDSKTTFYDMEKEFNNLARGTQEWREALVEVNKEVLELAEKYPMLKLISGANGQLSIDEASWDAQLAQQQQAYDNLISMTLAAQTERAALQTEKAYEDLAISSDYGRTGYFADQKFFDKNTAWLALNWGRLMDSETMTGQSWGKMLGDALITAGTNYDSSAAGLLEAQKARKEVAEDGYAFRAQEKLTGMASTDFMNLLAKWAEEGVSFDTSEFDEDTALATYLGLGHTDLEVFADIVRKGKSLGSAFDELTNQALALTMEEERMADTFIGNAVSKSSKVSTSNQGEAIIDLIKSVKSKEDYQSELDQKIADVKKEYANNEKALKQAYASATGKHFEAGKIWADASMEHEVKIETDDLYEAVAQIQLDLDYQALGETVLEGVSELSRDQKDLFNSLFKQEGQGITSKQIATYANGGIVNVSDIVKEFGFNNIEAMGDALGLDPIKLTETLVNNFEVANNRINKARQDVIKNMSKYAKVGMPKTFADNAEILKNWEMEYGEDIRNDLVSFFDGLTKTSDADFVSAGYEKLHEILAEGADEEQLSSIFEFINNINFANPIDALDSLNNEIKNGSGLSQNLAKTLKEVDSSYFGVQSQLSFLLQSNDFAGLQEDLGKILETNSEISATDVYDLADSYKSLNKILKNNDITAEALARTLQGIQQGEFTIEDLTDSVLAAVSTFKSLDSIVAKTIRDLEEFDLGVDENTVGETVGNWAELLKENLENGAVGNSQNFRILDYLFPGWDEGLEGDALVAEMTRLANKLEGNGQNLRTAWSDLAAGKDYKGNKAVFDGTGMTDEEKARFSNLSVVDTGKEILFSGWEGKGLTSNDLVDWISDAYEVSNEMASMMLADFKNYSADLAKELNANDYVTGIGKAYETMKEIAGTKFLSDKEIEAISKLTGKNEEQVRSDFEAKGAHIVDLYDDEGQIRNYEDVVLQMESIGVSAKQTAYDWTATFAETLDNGMRTIDLSEFEKQLGKIGITGADAEKLREQLFEQTVEGLKEGTIAGEAYLRETLANGDVVEIPVTADMTYEGFQQQLNKQIETAEYKAMAAAFAEQFGEIEIHFKVDSAIVDWLRSLGINIPISLDPADVESAKAQISAITEEGSVVDFVFKSLNSIADFMWYPGPIPLTFTASVTVQKIVQGIIEKVKSQTDGADLGNVNSSVTIPEYINPNWASGVKNASRSHIALVSEEGPELVQRAEGGAYLTGLNGPEMAQINKGDTVYTAKETAEIFKKRNHSLIPGFASGYGYGDAYGGASGGKSGGGSGSSGDSDVWENSIDKLYNLIQKIDEELRRRAQIERRYEKLLDSIDVSAEKIVAISREELSQLERDRMLQEEFISGRGYQIDKYQSENSDLKKYAQVVTDEFGHQVLRIDWNKINGVTDPDLGKRIEDYLSQLEDWMEDIHDAEDTLDEIEDAVEEIRERGREEYFDLEEMIKEALSQSYQEEIDKLENINSSIEETNTSLLDAIQKSVEKQRQERENKKTEDELAEKQRRLAYLQQDTSGANAMEILELQKEIAEGQQDYTDTLIDQKISELQEQNDEAAKQREQQIKLAQAQLDQYLETGGIWEEVYALMDEGLDPETGLIRGSRLEALLKNADGFKGLSSIGQMEWMKETNNLIAQGLAYLEIGRQLEDLGIAEGTTITFTNKKGQTLTGTVGKNGNVVGSDGKTYNNVYQGYDGKYYAGNDIGETAPPVVEGLPGSGSSSGSNSGSSSTQTKSNPYGTASAVGNYTARGGTQWGGNAVKAIQWALADMGYNPGAIDGGYGAGTAAAVKAFQRDNGIPADGDYGPQTREKMRLKGYNSGGLADFTGLAWLDGTKAKPEIVLDSQDSRNFIELRDILSAVLNRGSSSTVSENNGDITYDIDINVESLGSDYDVEQVANKVKTLISDDARYRNNNAVSLKR